MFYKKIENIKYVSALELNKYRQITLKQRMGFAFGMNRDLLLLQLHLFKLFLIYLYIW